ncbi:MAG: DUF4845 domain-containing protein [Gammaproteobacteria bacterium]
MHSMHQQKGVTAIGWLIILGLIGFFVLLILKMYPSYYEYYMISSTLETMSKDSGFESPAEIRDKAERRFDISYVDTITPKQLIIKPYGQSWMVTAKYESRVHLFYNVSVVMDFNKQVKLKRV